MICCRDPTACTNSTTDYLGASTRFVMPRSTVIHFLHGCLPSVVMVVSVVVIIVVVVIVVVDVFVVVVVIVVVVIVAVDVFVVVVVVCVGAACVVTLESAQWCAT